MAEKRYAVDAAEVEQPPEAPEIDIRFSMATQHVIAVGMLLLIVVLAAFGIFGETRDSVHATGTSLELSVDYPERFRFKEISYLRVWVTNRTSSPIDTLTVAFDSTYADGFSQKVFVPISVKPWEVELIAVAPGESRRIDVEIQAELYGRHSGEIQAWFEGSDTTSVRIATFTLP